MPPRYLLRGCYRSLSTTPLRGSRGQQPRGAPVSAAMVAPCAGEVLRAAVLDREPLPCACGVWGRLVAWRVAELRPRAPTHPASLAAGFASLPTAPLPPTKKSAQQGHAQRRKAVAEVGRKQNEVTNRFEVTKGDKFMSSKRPLVAASEKKHKRPQS